MSKYFIHPIFSHIKCSFVKWGWEIEVAQHLVWSPIGRSWIFDMGIFTLENENSLWYVFLSVCLSVCLSVYSSTHHIFIKLETNKTNIWFSYLANYICIFLYTYMLLNSTHDGRSYSYFVNCSNTQQMAPGWCLEILVK